MSYIGNEPCRSSWQFLWLWIAACLLQATNAIKMFESNSLNPCMKNSSFAASRFHLSFTPDNNTITFDINGFSQITAYVVLDVEVLGYGYSIAHPIIDPCKETSVKLGGICPMNAAPLQIVGNLPMDKETVKRIPAPIYFIPDLDLKVRVWMNSTETGKPIACVEADLGNTQTVHQKGVGWSIALIVLLGLVLSAIVSGLGHSNTAAHLASNALSLFGYFQSQALIGMTAVSTPPVVRAWTQNFQWSMGIIRVDFLQRLATWYQRATGGKPSTYLSTLATTSIQVQKRSNNVATNVDSLTFPVVKGIERVGFVGDIEITNIFFTSYIFFVIFILFTTIGVLLFKQVCELLIRMRKMRPDRFHEFRTGWTVMLKGILFRIVLITFPQIVVLGFWEITKRDSSAEVVIAVTSVLGVMVLLGLASMKVWKYARRSIELHQNPAYILYSDMKVLNKWGFLYIQFKAPMYFFVVPILLYTLLKCLFIALGQKSGTLQAVALVVLDLALLIAISIMRPYMDKKTNGFNISIAAVNFVNAMLLLFFTGIFGVPPLAIGVMGVLFFLLNSAFALVIIILVLWTSISAVISKNPETRYQPMRDDRGSFIKSQNNLNTELDALGVTARGDKSRRMPIDDEEPVGLSMQQEYIRSASRLGPRVAEKRGFGISHDSLGTATGSLRGSHSTLLPVNPRSPLPGSGFSSPLRTESPLPEVHAPINWKTGVGY